MDFVFPPIVFGSSALGNLYKVIPFETKRAIVQNWFKYAPAPVVIDSAGKYGAGLSLEMIGRLLRELNVAEETVVISNKLGWKRTALTTSEPTFEPEAWAGIEHDAVQCISYDGILECWEQGNDLLGDYRATLVSVHDPDEYLNAAQSDAERAVRYQDILGAYRALNELKAKGEVKGVGIGSKDWQVIKRLYDEGVAFDWVMFANSFTVMNHPADVLAFMAQLHEAGVRIINSAVFQAGFLITGAYYDYAIITREEHPKRFEWRDQFHALCEKFSVTPAFACCQFGMSPPGVEALALNTSRPEKVETNVQSIKTAAPDAFWDAMKAEGLIAKDYPHL